MSKYLSYIEGNVNKRDILDWAEGVNGLIAVTESTVYLVRDGLGFGRKTVKTYAISGISSIETKNPNLMTNGHFQILASGNADSTKKFGSAFSYAKDENTVMVRSNFDHFKRIEALIFKQKSKANTVNVVVNSDAQKTEESPIDKIKKLAELRDSGIITNDEFEEKKRELLLVI